MKKPARLVPRKKLAGDVGRPVPDLASTLLDPDLDDDAREVLRTLVPLDKPVDARASRKFALQMIPTARWTTASTAWSSPSRTWARPPGSRKKSEEESEIMNHHEKMRPERPLHLAFSYRKSPRSFEAEPDFMAQMLTIDRRSVERVHPCGLQVGHAVRGREEENSRCEMAAWRQCSNLARAERTSTPGA